MKKNISINISGIIFHIEEDGYEKFKAYLDAINQYFSSYDESEEIIADIESRMAEIFLSKLTEGKQVVSLADVEELVQTMGTIADFEAIEEENDFAEEPKTKAQNEHKQQQTRSKQSHSGSSKKVLRRNLNDRLLGGVASGLAHYFNTDSIWVRVLWLLFFSTGIGLLAYIALWIAIPGSYDIVENENIKKLYRDPEDSVLGGVASGLAKYFNTEPIVFRIIFIISFFGGIGLIAYIILWIITPQASSLTDRMQMKGEKVTLTNIDSNIKKGKEEDLNPKGENIFTKVLLFPFRLIGNIFTGLGRALGPIFQLIVAGVRVFTGGIITIVAISVMFSLLVTAGVVFGLYNGDWFYWGNDWEYLTSEIITNTVPELGMLFLLTALFIPFLYLFIAGITIIAKRRVMSSSVGWSILGVWMIAVVGTSATIPNIVKDFREEGYYEQEETIAFQGDTLLIEMNRIKSYFQEDRRYRDRGTDYSIESEFTDLDLRPSRNGEMRLEQRFRARGRTISTAEEHAQEVDYNYTVTGNRIIFDSDITFDRGARFRFQELDLTLYLPKNTPFKVERGIRDLMHYFAYRYSWWQVYRNTWMFNDDGELVCLTCENRVDSNSESSNRNEQTLTPEPFTGVQVSGNLNVQIVHGSDHEITIIGSNPDIEALQWQSLNNKLTLDAPEDISSADLTIKIRTPQISNITLRDNAQLRYYEPEESFLKVELYNKSALVLGGEIETLELRTNDRSKIDLEGKIDKLDATALDRGRLYAYEASINRANITSKQDARIRINIIDYLNAEASGFSSIRYKGSPEVNITHESNSASITKY